METLDRYTQSVIEAQNMDEINTAKDEYIKALHDELNELRMKARFVDSFVEVYLDRGYYEKKNGEDISDYSKMKG